MLKVFEEAARLSKSFDTPYAKAIRDALLANYMRAENCGIFNSTRLEELKQGIYSTRPGGCEPPTRGLEIRCSSPLSYGRST